MRFRHNAHLRRAALAFLVAATASPLAGEPAAARKIACKASQVPVPDERGGGNLCISKKEQARAKAICKANGSSNWLECTCQDAGTVAACGD